MLRHTPWIIALLLLFALSSCFDSTNKGLFGATDGQNASGDTTSGDVTSLDSVADTSVSPDLTDGSGPQPTTICQTLAVDRTAETKRALYRYALSRASAIVEGRFGAIEQVGTQRFAAFEVDKVHFGWQFLAGMKVTIAIPANTPNGSELPPSAIVALSNPYPQGWQTSLPLWGNTAAIIPISEAPDYADLLAYRSESTPLVALVKLVERDEYRATFEVLETLRGELPTTFQLNWYASWKLPYPGISGSERHPEISKLEIFVASLAYVSPIRGSDVELGSLVDLRPASDDTVATVKTALANETPFLDRAALAKWAEDYLVGFDFHRSPAVVASTVTGLADECCTGAGGTLVESRIDQGFKGESVGSLFLTGGHGYYGGESCGDRHLFGLEELRGPIDASQFETSCLPYPDSASYGPDPNAPLFSRVWARLPFSDENRDRVQRWVDASHPVYQLQLPESVVDPQDLTQNPENAPWSQIADPLYAYLSASTLVLFTVESVAPRNGFTEIRIRTTFSRYEYDHMERVELKLALPCQSAGLLVPKSRWVGAFVAPTPSYLIEGAARYVGAFLIPGTLLPEWAISDQLASWLEYHP